MSDPPRKAHRPRAGRSPSTAVLSSHESEETQRQLEKAASDQTQLYVLRLYVTGATPASTRAIEKVHRICEERLHGRYELEVIDIYQLPELAKGHQIIATPTLVRVLPEPLRRFIGDLSRVEKILFGLDLREKT